MFIHVKWNKLLNALFHDGLIVTTHCFLIAPGSVGTQVVSDTSVRFQYAFDAKNPAADLFVIVVKDSEPKKYCTIQRGDEMACKITGLMSQTTYEFNSVLCISGDESCGDVFTVSAKTAPERKFIYAYPFRQGFQIQY